MFFSKTEIKTTTEIPNTVLNDLRNKANIYVSFKQLAKGGYTAFSVERMCVEQGQAEHTVVSCLDYLCQSVDFSYDCSREQHNAIVADFINFCNEPEKQSNENQNS